MMSTDSQTPVQKYTCPECHAGHMETNHITYFTWLAGELITVPDFPAWVCDVCGRREYDGQAIAQLNILLNPNTGSSSKINKRKTRSDHPPAQP
jgi:YgiT-type zinc finger domain-containing protein